MPQSHTNTAATKLKHDDLLPTDDAATMAYPQSDMQAQLELEKVKLAQMQLQAGQNGGMANSQFSAYMNSPPMPYPGMPVAQNVSSSRLMYHKYLEVDLKHVHGSHASSVTS